MKNLLLILLLACFFETSFAQELAADSSNIISKETLLLKRKNQKRTANILLITGGSLVVISPIIALASVANHVGTWGEKDINTDLPSAIATIGILMSAASVPFYISAGRNKRKAAAISFQQQKIPYLQRSNIATSMIPAVSIKIKL